MQGSSGAFGYSLSFTPAANRLDVSGTLCFQWGSICSNGPSNGLSLEVNVSGYIDVGSDAAAISVNGGRVTHSSISVKDLHAHLKFSYTAARGTGPDSGGDPPVFRVPVGIDYTIAGEIPIYIKVQTALLVKLGLSSKNTVLRGGVQYDSSGSDSVDSSGSSVSGSGAGGNPAGKILDASDGGTGASTALGAGGVVVAVQFPKLGVGLGVRALNGIGYLDMVTSIGQTAAGAIAGGCTYDFAWSEGGGFEAQAGPLALATPRKILIPTSGRSSRRASASRAADRRRGGRRSRAVAGAARAGRRAARWREARWASIGRAAPSAAPGVAPADRQREQALVGALENRAQDVGERIGERGDGRRLEQVAVEAKIALDGVREHVEVECEIEPCQAG